MGVTRQPASQRLRHSGPKTEGQNPGLARRMAGPFFGKAGYGFIGSRRIENHSRDLLNSSGEDHQDLFYIVQDGTGSNLWCVFASSGRTGLKLFQAECARHSGMPRHPFALFSR